jgi:hypothetical protein
MRKGKNGKKGKKGRKKSIFGFWIFIKVFGNNFFVF